MRCSELQSTDASLDIGDGDGTCDTRAMSRAPSPASRHVQPRLDAVASELASRVAGEVRFDARARALWATDASPYEIRPYGVVLPKTIDDVRAVVDIANRHGLPILPRGGGTSLAGQTVGEAIVVDFSKYMTAVLDLDLAKNLVRVQPGVVRDDLNLYLRPHELQFTPDISTTDRANVGGMVANNSAGTRSIKYGKTVDAVVAMTVMLSDGSIVEVGEVTPEELARKKAQDDLEGQIYRVVHEVVETHADAIAERYPKVMRRVGGYNLDELIGGRPFNLAKLISGSEGTLAIILDVTLSLAPVPRHKMLAMVHFGSMENALTAVQYINRHKPSAVEILDDRIFELAGENPALRPLLHWVEGAPAAVLMVEFDGVSDDEMRRGLNGLQDDPQVAELAYHTHLAFSYEEQEDILAFRRKGLGIYATIRGRRKPTAFIEDAAIPPQHLPRYIPEVKEVCRRHGADLVVYGHASVGVIHIRPLLDMKTADGVEAYRRISEETFELVRKYGGSWSGEHGDGLIRSYKNRELFGDELYEAFRGVKRAFDSRNLMNPGKIVDAPPMTENLRYGAGYPDDPTRTTMDFSAHGGYLGAIEMCTGVGACRKTTSGTMCPSYMVTLDEDHSTRGRANILREAITGGMPGGLTSKDVYDVLDLCLECKACKAECPSRVDMATIKSEFLQQYWDDHGVPLSAFAIGNVATVAPLAQKLAAVSNALLPLAPVRWAIEKTVGVDRRRVLPRYASEDFASWFRRRARKGPDADAPAAPLAPSRAETSDGSTAGSSAASDGPGATRRAPAARPGSSKAPPRVALFADTWTMYNEPSVGQAATRVLERLGYAVELVPYGCCGRPMISKGLLRRARRLAEHNVARLQRYVDEDVPVVGLEPSCVTAFQDDYRSLIPGEATDRAADHVKMIDQFLAKAWTSGALKPDGAFAKDGERILLHGHCQQKAIIGTAPTHALLGWVSDDVHEVDSGCCGMAGSFGYSHHEVSMKSGERRLFPAVREHAGPTVACGFSCRHQIADGTGRGSQHVMEVLASHLTEPRD